MTSFAFILGVVPLVLSEGAGAEMRRTLGMAVFSGMLGVTLFGIFLTPVFYYVIQWVSDIRTERRQRAGLFAETTQNGRPYQDAPANGHPRPSHHGEEFDGDDDGVGDGAIGHPSAHDEDLLATGAEIGE